MWNAQVEIIQEIHTNEGLLPLLFASKQRITRAMVQWDIEILTSNNEPAHVSWSGDFSMRSSSDLKIQNLGGKCSTNPVYREYTDWALMTQWRKGV